MPAKLTAEDTLHQKFNANGRKFELVGPDGAVDGYFVVDALARGLVFDNQQAAKELAAAMMQVNAAMTYLECEPNHPYNRSFLNGFINAMRAVDKLAADAGIKSVTLPHSFGFFNSPHGKAIRKHVAQFGIEKSFRLPSGTIVSFRDKPYSLDLSRFGKINWDAGLLIKINPDEYRTDVKPSQLLSPNSRGMASATDRAKSAWDIGTQPDFVAPRQLSLGLDNPNKKAQSGSTLEDIRQRAEKDRADFGFLISGLAPA
ncbi:MAG: hypothetical protein KGQ41_01155 [Alphaproteobacteria bacterium]|nr:hypothetical protein [Alphaproteobacteria bacterium]